MYFTNPSTALNAVIKSMHLEKGDAVLTTNHEYWSLDRTWKYYSQLKKYHYKKVDVKIPYDNKETFIEKIKESITSKTNIIYLSHITSSTGLIFPAKEICDIARQNNIISIIDGAHAPGHIDLNIKELNPDVYVGACHKWMCSPKGVSFLYVKKELQNRIDPLVISWGYESEGTSLLPGNNDKTYKQFISNHEWQGTRDMSAYLTIPATIKFLNDNNWSSVASKCRETNLWARKKINELLNKTSICSEKFLGQMSSIYLDFKNPIESQINFYKKYNIQIPFIIWNDISMIRISIQAYNSKDDILKLLEALEKEYC